MDIRRATAIRATSLIRATARRVRNWAESLAGPVRIETSEAPQAPVTATAPPLEPIRRLLLTDAVSRALFEEYAAHRTTDRREEETGWELLGIREPDSATVLACVPAGANRDAGEAHIRFNTVAQALAYRILWQAERRLTILGVVHTHPGRLRHPSRRDYEGDREWVRNLRGKEGVFGIGTLADGPAAGQTEVGQHPRPNIQTFGGLRFDWYVLAAEDKRYRPIPVELVVGPNLAAPLRGVWDTIEENAPRLDRLARQLTRARFAVAEGKDGPALMVTIPLGPPDMSVRVLLEGKTARYLYESNGEVFVVDSLAGTAPDQGVYLLLAELAARN